MIARILTCVVVLTVAQVLEVAVINRLPLPGATPSLVLVAVVGLALAYGRLPGAAIGFAAGLLLDLAPPAVTVAGRWALVLCLVGYVAGAARDLPRRLLTALALVAGFSVAAPAVFAALGEIVGDGDVHWPTVASLMPYAVAYNLLLTPLLVLALRALTRRIEPPVRLR